LIETLKQPQEPGPAVARRGSDLAWNASIRSGRCAAGDPGLAGHRTR